MLFQQFLFEYDFSVNHKKPRCWAGLATNIQTDSLHPLMLLTLPYVVAKILKIIANTKQAEMLTSHKI